MKRKIGRDWYFGHFGDTSYGGNTAPCQACQLPMEETDLRMHQHPEAAHKIPRSLGGSDELENLVILHAICHSLLDGGTDYKMWQGVLRDSVANAKIGGHLDMNQAQLKKLREHHERVLR